MPHNLMRNGAMYLYGFVGESYWDDGFDASQVLDALAEHGSGDLTVHLNSGGGYAREGVAIYNALQSHDGEVTIHIDALAASAASIIAMAGARIEMGEGAIMMIHNASVLTVGNADDHDKSSEYLRLIDKQASGIYAKRTGQTAASVAKMMDDETWMGVEEAIEKGFADAEEGSVAEPTAFDYRVYQHAPEQLTALAKQHGWAFQSVKPAAPAAPPKEQPTMVDKPKTATAGNQNTGTDKPADPVVQVSDTTAIEAAAKQAEKARGAGIRKAGAVMNIEQAVIDKMIAEDVTLDDARAQMTDIAAAKQDNDEGGNLPAGQVITDARDRFMTGASLAVMARAGIKGGERNEFTGLTLSELARDCLQTINRPARGMTRMEMVGQAFMAGGQHGSSDFGNILANVANKAMLIGYEEAPETFPLITRTGTLTDFKPMKRVDLGLFDNLAEVPEGAEYTYGSVSDRGELITLATYGKLFSISRQAVINDDLDAFSRIPARMGRAAKRTVGNLVWAIITGNPALSDTVALFHADHGNLAGSGAAPGVATLSAGKTAMAVQKDPDEKAATGLNIRPKYLIVPFAHGDTANVLVASEFDPGKTQRTPNPHRSTLEVVTDARLDANSSTAWYLSADPNTVDTLEVAYLDGNQEPYMEQREGWNVDGAEMKVRLDAAAAPLDFRGLYKNPGQ